MLLVYTHKATHRFGYIMKYLFTDLLGIPVVFSTTVEDFIKHTGPKITYTNQPLQNEFFIRSHELLFERGIRGQRIDVGAWEDIPCFFATNERSNLPYDIFAASFYLIARYEEYLPHEKDVHGRFSPKNSVAYQNDFLKFPVIDIWAFKLFEALKLRFPTLEMTSRNYGMAPLIDVTTSHAYAHRGFLRSLGGLFMDMGKLRFRALPKRIGTWFNSKTDPYDNFGFLVELHKSLDVKALFFFQFAKYSTFDKNISPTKNAFRYLIKSIADYSTIGLAASYSSFFDNDLLKEERRTLAEVVNRPIDNIRSRYNRVVVPQTYRDMVDAGFANDFSMGYTHEIGFRAGTCTPFYFYDLVLESRQPIKIHPFAIHDYALVNFSDADGIMTQINGIYKSIRKVKGKFVAIFSNELLGGDQSVDWKQLYVKILREYHV